MMEKFDPHWWEISREFANAFNGEVRWFYGTHGVPTWDNETFLDLMGAYCAC